MKKTLLAALVLLSTSLGLRAEETSSSYSITADFVYVSEYIFRGIEQQARPSNRP